jgi:hypothetical protein
MNIGASPVPTSPVSQPDSETGRSLVPASQLDMSHHVSEELVPIQTLLDNAPNGHRQMVTLSPRRLAEQPLLAAVTAGAHLCWSNLIYVSVAGVPTYGLSAKAHGLGACRRHGAVTVQITSR